MSYFAWLLFQWSMTWKTITIDFLFIYPVTYLVIVISRSYQLHKKPNTPSLTLVICPPPKRLFYELKTLLKENNLYPIHHAATKRLSNRKKNPFHDALRIAQVWQVSWFSPRWLGSLVSLQNLNIYKKFCVRLTSVFQHHAKVFSWEDKWSSPTDLVVR